VLVLSDFSSLIHIDFWLGPKNRLGLLFVNGLYKNSKANMPPRTLGPDENGWTYTLAGRCGLLVGNDVLNVVHSYTRRAEDSYFMPMPPDKSEREDLPISRYQKIIVVRKNCEKVHYGRPKESYTSYKLFLFTHDDKCEVRKFHIL
jgi:hypothetical protein